MNRHGATQRIFAACLILSLHAFLVPSFAGTATSSLTGRVVVAGAHSPIGTGKIHVGNPRTGQIATADLSREGTFTVSGLAAGTYEVAVETGGVMNVASNPVLLGPDQNKAVQIAVNTKMAQTGNGDPMKDDPATAQKQKKQTGTSFWNNPLTATAIVVVSAVVVGLAIDGLSDDDEQPASAQ
jgi:hypothetical protein